MYLFESEESVELDQAMEIAKENGDWEEHDVLGIFAKQANQFDHFCETEHEGNFRSQKNVAVPHIPALSSPPTGKKEKGVNHKG